MMHAADPSRELELRRLRYRLQRLGMLELEGWLGRLQPALDAGDEAVIRAAAVLMEMSTEELQCMMQAQRSLPEVLRPWLEVKVG